MNKHHDKNLWGIILAGGNGKRLQAFTRRFYHLVRPKQYCVFVGTRSMVQHTFDRARMLVAAERILTVVSGKHRHFVGEQFPDQPVKSFIVQPYCRETAPAILLPLIKIHRQNTKAVVTVFPSDHFILDEVRFAHYVRAAVEYVGKNSEKIVLLGVRPDHEECGFGWIEKGEALHCPGMHHVKSFIEKPKNSDAGSSVKEYFWNTFVIIGRTDTIMKHVRKTIPDVYDVLKGYEEAIDTGDEQQAILEAYHELSPVNFSSAVLEKIPSALCVIDISDVGWSDWGEERRIMEDVDRFNLHLNTLDSERQNSIHEYFL
jgi:mannose-1-phosphate guanylyltransferase